MVSREVRVYPNQLQHHLFINYNLNLQFFLRHQSPDKMVSSYMKVSNLHGLHDWGSDLEKKMAKANMAASCLSFILIICLLSTLSMVEGRRPNVGSGSQSAPKCTEVVGVEDGSTCFEITDQLKLPNVLFKALNPNLDCTKLFVGQWICVDGKL